METPVSDLALLEWVRFGETRLAPESSEEVRAALAVCGALRQRLEGFQRMELMLRPFGEDPPSDLRPLVARRLLLLLLGLLSVAMLWFLI